MANSTQIDYAMLKWMADHKARFEYNEEHKVIVLYIGEQYCAMVIPENAPNVWSEYIICAIVSLHKEIHPGQSFYTDYTDFE